MTRRFRQQRERGGFHPGLDLVESTGQRRRLGTNLRMRHESKKLMQAWPGNRPICGSLRELSYTRECIGVKGRLLTMRVNEQVRIEGNHAPCSSNAAARSLSHDISRNSGCRPLPLKVARRSRNALAGFASDMIPRSPTRSEYAVSRPRVSRAYVLHAAVGRIFNSGLHDSLMGNPIWAPIPVERTALCNRAAQTGGKGASRTAYLVPTARQPMSCR